MKFLDINWYPNDKQLRQFGVACLVAFPLLAWLWIGGARAIMLGAAVGLGCFLTGFIFPRALRPVYVTLTCVTLPIGVVVGEIFLALVFFGVVLPIGLIFRVRRRDALERTIDKNAVTYWRPKKQPPGVASYFRQF